ncbi:CbrC family protein [Bacillus pumilus]|nr:CbrC family protein [Bacillus pumilus]MCY7723332.1 CbrC family protein [Bacillus pumilus]MCY7746885.1 CbrC family protein [Bacillus pumilus]
MTLPTFKYNPDPVSLNVIKKEPTTCPVCEKERDYVYHGPFYTVEDVKEFALGVLKMDEPLKNTMAPFKTMQVVMTLTKRNI